MESEIRDRLGNLFGENVRFDCSMKKFTTFRIGGEAGALIEVDSNEQLQTLFQVVSTYGLKWEIIGKGSNLLVSDDGFDGLILRLGPGYKQIEKVQDKKFKTYRVGAGLTLTKLVKWCQKKSLCGTEFLFGIPGSLGGAAIMNAGAWGSEVSTIVIGVEVVTSAGERFLSNEQLGYEYRRCRYWQNLSEQAVLTHVHLSLEEGDAGEIKNRCKKLLEKRLLKQPKGLPNAGSFFKNPAGDSAGRLIEASGLKGFRVGDALVSNVHANFLVNDGKASSYDVLRLMKIVQEKVRKDSGFLLEPEVHFI